MNSRNELWTCAFCGKKTTEYPATSRKDSTTEICSDCALGEALNDYVNSPPQI